MQDSFPKPVNGMELRLLRKAQGVPAAELASRIGISEKRVFAWETATPLDPIRAARYERAIRAYVAEKTAGTHVGSTFGRDA